MPLLLPLILTVLSLRWVAAIAIGVGMALVTLVWM